jgi:hypothetical protein
VDLGAPGEAVLSTVPGGYASMSGTSMAAPQISGIAAAALGVRPLLSAEHLAAALLAGGDPLGGLAGLTRSRRRASLAGTMAVVLGGAPPEGAPPPALGPPAPRSSPPASRRVRLRLTAPRPLRPRARGVLRLESTRAGRVRIAVRHPGRRGLVGAFTTPVGAGTARARIPAGLAMRMSRPGRYRVTATLAGARPATATLVVRDSSGRSRPG